MAQNLKNSLLIAVVILLISCKEIQQPPIQREGIQPLWETRLPGKAGIYHYGLEGLPTYNGNILFHSSYMFAPAEEDNRIHALNMKTGQIQWTFPLTYVKSKPMVFSSMPYIFNGNLVVKMLACQTFSRNDKIVCINLNTGMQSWEKELPQEHSLNSRSDIVGVGNKFYFTERSETSTIFYTGDILTGEITLLKKIDAKAPNNICEPFGNPVLVNTDSGKSYLISGGMEKVENIYSINNPSFLYVIDLKTNELVDRIAGEVDESYSFNDLFVLNDKLFYTSGRVCACYNFEKMEKEWTYRSAEPFNYMANRLVVSDSIIFLHGPNRFIGLSTKFGTKVFQGDLMSSGGASIANGYVYVISNDSKLYILNAETGKIVQRIVCPEEYEKNPRGFGLASIPKVYGDKLYLFGNYHAYCYDATPKTKAN